MSNTANKKATRGFDSSMSQINFIQDGNFYDSDNRRQNCWDIVLK